MTTQKDKIIEQILKLSELTRENSGAFQGEISNASAMIQKLMDKYSISQFDLDSKESEKIDREFTNKPSDAVLFSVLSWHWSLAKLISRITHTRNYVTTCRSSEPVARTAEFIRDRTYQAKKKNSYRAICFFGSPENVSVAAELFYEWIVRINTMASLASTEYMEKKKQVEKEARHILFSDKREYYMHMKAMGVESSAMVYRNSWLQGCLNAMNEKVRQQETEREPETSKGLILYKDAVNLAYADFSKDFNKVNSGGIKSFSSAGYNAGVKAGSKISLHPTKKLNTGRKLLKG